MVRIVGNTREEDIAFYPVIESDVVTAQGEYRHYEGILNTGPWNRLKTTITLVADSRDPQKPLVVTYDPPLGQDWWKTEGGEYWTNRIGGMPVYASGEHEGDEKVYLLKATPLPCPAPMDLLDYPEFDPNSLIGHVHANVSYMLDGVTPGSNSQDQWDPSQPIVYSFTEPSLTPNPNLWCKEMDFSCVSVFRNGLGAGTNPWLFPFILLNERYVISAGHIAGAGVRIQWKRKDGSYVDRTITRLIKDSNWKLDPGWPSEEGFPFPDDVAVCELNEDVTGIEPAWLFDETLQDKVSRRVQAQQAEQTVYGGSLVSHYYYRWPTVCRTANIGGVGGQFNSPSINTNSPHFRTLCATFDTGNVLTKDWGLMMVDDNPADSDKQVFPNNARLERFRKFTHNIYGGDSGSPHFLPVVLPVGLKPVLIMAQHTATNGGYLGGKTLELIRLSMQKMAAERGESKTYNLQVADISAYPDYTVPNLKPN